MSMRRKILNENKDKSGKEKNEATDIKHFIERRAQQRELKERRFSTRAPQPSMPQEQTLAPPAQQEPHDDSLNQMMQGIKIEVEKKESISDDKNNKSQGQVHDALDHLLQEHQQQEQQARRSPAAPKLVFSQTNQTNVLPSANQTTFPIHELKQPRSKGK